MGFTSRLAQTGDFDFVWKGRKETADIEGFAIPNVEEDKVRVKDAIVAGKVLLAVSGKELVGFIWFVANDGSKVPFGLDYGAYGVKYVFVSYVYTKPEYRGKGVGRFLYENLEKYCKKNGISEIILDVHVKNPGSAEFHKKLGFESRVNIYKKMV